MMITVVIPLIIIIKVSGITGGGKSINIIFIHTRIISFKTNQLAVFLRTKLLK